MTKNDKFLTLGLVIFETWKQPQHGNDVCELFVVEDDPVIGWGLSPNDQDDMAPDARLILVGSVYVFMYLQGAFVMFMFFLQDNAYLKK